MESINLIADGSSHNPVKMPSGLIRKAISGQRIKTEVDGDSNGEENQSKHSNEQVVFEDEDESEGQSTQEQQITSDMFSAVDQSAKSVRGQGADSQVL